MSVRLTTIRFLGIASVIALSASAWSQTTWYVDCDSPGPGDGSLGNPFCSIQVGIDAATDGDTVLVLPGTYNETIDFNGLGIALRSFNGPDVTTIDGSGLNDSVVKCVNAEGPATVLEGFTIRGADTSDLDDQGGGMHNEYASPTIRECVFEANVGGDGGGMANIGSSPTIISSVFKYNRASDGAGLYNCNSSYAFLVNCVFLGNAADFGSNPLGGAIGSEASTLTLQNCTIFQNSANLDGGAIANYGGTVIADNCVFWENSPNEIADMAGGVSTVNYSCISGGWSGPGEGNIAIDPLLDADGHLSPGSPCIDAGDTTVLEDPVLIQELGGVVFADLDATGRVLDDACTPDTGIPAGLVPVTVDMGAYEYNGLPGDIDGDCDVDLSDLAQLLAHYGETSPWHYYNGHYYTLTNPGTWDEVEAEAVARGGHLVTVNDGDENQWLLDTFAQEENIWIGFYQLPDSEEPAGGWVWASGEPVTYTNWISGEPNDDEGESWAELKCAGSAWPGQWNDQGDDAMRCGIIELSR